MRQPRRWRPVGYMINEVRKINMNLKKQAVLASASAVMLVLQGCAGTTALKDTTKSLSVHQDNRISYLMVTQSHSETVRAWSATNDILAIRVNNKLINSKDIDWIDVRSTREPRTPMTITVALLSGEQVSAQFADWGSEQHIEGKVEWVACTVDKKCEYLKRGTSNVTFGSFPGLLTGTSSGAIERAAADVTAGGFSASRAEERLTTSDLSRLLPGTHSASRMQFQRFDQLPTLKNLLQVGLKRYKAFRQCVSEKLDEYERGNREGEARIRGDYSGAQLTRMLETHSIRTNRAGQQVQAEMICRQMMGTK